MGSVPNYFAGEVCHSLASLVIGLSRGSVQSTSSLGAKDKLHIGFAFCLACV